MAPPEETIGDAETPKPRPREIAFDLVKGIGILEVLIHHSFSSSARKFYAEGSTEWWALMLVNRVLHFAIPTFLLASAILLARSLAKNDAIDLKRYANRRLWRTVWPYLVWSAVYLLFRVFVIRNADDVEPYRASLFGFSMDGPRALLDVGVWGRELLWGKAYFHLYFLVVLIQMSVLLPLLVWVLRGKRIRFWAIVAISAALQVAMFMLQSAWWRAPYPGSLAAWYVPSLLIGTWLGLNWSQWPEIWLRNRGWIFAAIGVSLPVYLWLATQVLQKETVSSLAFNVAFAAYGASVALALLGVSTAVNSETRWTRTLVAIGALSLPIFVIHPLAMYGLGGPSLTEFLARTPAVPILVLVALFGLTWIVTRALIFLRLNAFLFGRNFRS